MEVMVILGDDCDEGSFEHVAFLCDSSTLVREGVWDALSQVFCLY